MTDRKTSTKKDPETTPKVTPEPEVGLPAHPFSPYAQGLRPLVVDDGQRDE